MQCTRNFPRCPEGVILGCGNPLLDMRVESCWTTMIYLIHRVVQRKIHFAFVSLKSLQWILNAPNRSVLFGCIGDGHYGDILRQKTQEIGLRIYYQVKEKQKTGTSLCAHLAAANLFTIDHLEKPESRVLIETAQYFYISVNLSTTLKVFATNLAAPFVLKYFRDEFLGVLPYVDILFGNERESKAFADANNYNTHELQQINMQDKKKRTNKQINNYLLYATIVNIMLKINEKHQRIVILTQGSDPTIVYQNGNNDAVKYPVKKLKHEEIVDTNGAVMHLLEKSVAESVKCGHYAAAVIIQQEGCTLPPICLYH
uniref:Adenosine kinase n=1 Tax=Wuchereria bancrofti TaxID=6293 RepID=A0A1I8EEL8_WUCBA